MNEQSGWFYRNLYNRGSAWTSVELLHDFLTTNKGIGHYGKVAAFRKVRAGNIIQLSFDGKLFPHSLFCN